MENSGITVVETNKQQQKQFSYPLWWTPRATRNLPEVVPC